MHRILGVLSALTLCACSSDRVSLGVVGTSLPDLLRETVSVTLERGSVHVGVAPGPALEIEAEVLVDADRAAQFGAAPLVFGEHVAVTSDADTVLVRSAHEGAGDDDDWELRLRVLVPEAPAVRARVDAGSIEVRLDSAAALSADVDAGSIDAAIGRIAGPTVLKVSAGRIRLRAEEALRGATLTVATGEIELVLPRDVAGRLDAVSQVGSVDVAPRFGLERRREVTKQSVAGALGSGGDDAYVLRVDAGTISVQ